MYKPRTLESTITTLARSFPVLLVVGARQVGKTTLLRHILPASAKSNFRYVSLDEFEIRSLAKRDPNLFLQHYPPPLMIDEIQHAPELLPAIKADVDRKRRFGAYWLTGSQQFHMMKNVTESLAGRIGIIKLFGLSYAEEHELLTSREPWLPTMKSHEDRFSMSLLAYFRRIIRGTFPALLQRNAPPLDNFYGSYVQTYLDRDLRDFLKISSLSSFEKFLTVCAARTATVLNLSDLARDCDVAVNTVKDWLSLLEASGQIFFLRPYYRNISKRVIKSPKMYFFDTGLVSYLTGWRDPSVASKGAFAGPLFETYVLSELMKSYLHRGLEPRFYYFRTKQKQEIDLLIEKDGVLFPVEVKLSLRPRPEDMKTVDVLRLARFPLGDGAIIAPISEPIPLERGLIAFPPTSIR